MGVGSNPAAINLLEYSNMLSCELNLGPCAWAAEETLSHEEAHCEFRYEINKLGEDTIIFNRY